MSNETPPEKQLRLHHWLAGGSHSSSNIPLVAQTIISFCNGDILDVGCGNGDLLRELINLGVPRNKLFGCDIEEDHVVLARQRTSALPIV